MTHTAYSSNLTDPQWQTLAPLIPPARPGGRPRGLDMRRVLDGILYVLRNGCAWAAMPHDLPSGKSCWFYFNRFSVDGTWERISAALHPMARIRCGRDPEPSEAMIDAQDVKTTKRGARPARSATTRARRSRVVSGMWRSTRWG